MWQWLPLALAVVLVLAGDEVHDDGVAGVHRGAILRHCGGLNNARRWKTVFMPSKAVALIFRSLGCISPCNMADGFGPGILGVAATAVSSVSPVDPC
jgi:hypothetical protein